MGWLLLTLAWLEQLGLELDDMPEVYGDGTNVVKLLQLLREPDATSREGRNENLRRVRGKHTASANFCQYCGEDTRDLKKLKARMRFSWLNGTERRYGSDHTRFRVSGIPSAEDDNEGPMFDKARKKAKDTNEAVTVNVVLLEKRGEIDSFPWALVRPNGTIEYVYP